MEYFFAILGRLAKFFDNCPTRDCHPLAQEGIQTVLEMEEPTEMAWKTEDPH